MKITQCDICKKTIEKDSTSICIGLGSIFSNHVEICTNCGKPVLKLMKDKKLLKGENKKYGE